MRFRRQRSKLYRLRLTIDVHQIDVVVVHQNVLEERIDRHHIHQRRLLVTRPDQIRTEHDRQIRGGHFVQVFALHDFDEEFDQILEQFVVFDGQTFA